MSKVPTQTLPELPELRDPTDEEAKRVEEEFRLTRAKVLVKMPFCGQVTLSLKFNAALKEHGVPTAAVSADGSLYVNVQFWDSLTKPQQRGLVVHEVFHPAFMQFQRQGTRVAMVELNGQTVSLWNIAGDLSFNGMIATCSPGHIELPPGALHETQYDGKSTEEIYDILFEKAKKNAKKNGPQKGMPSLSGMGMDGFGKDGPGDDMRDDLAQTETGQQAAKGSKAAQKKLENEWKVTVAQAAQVHEREVGKGTLPAGLQKVVDDLLNPKVRWQDALSRWMGENGKRADYSFRRPSRRSFADDNIGYLPSLQRWGIDKVLILWDTSGSMNGRETEILTEVASICDDLDLSARVLFCDTQVYDGGTVRDAMDLVTEIRGGGGSDFNAAFRMMEEENYDGVCVAFTDGYIDVPPCPPPNLKATLWCLTNHDVDPTGGKWGEVLHIPED